jgi:hypothetical protein
MIISFGIIQKIEETKMNLRQPQQQEQKLRV